MSEELKTSESVEETRVDSQSTTNSEEVGSQPEENSEDDFVFNEESLFEIANSSLNTLLKPNESETAKNSAQEESAESSEEESENSEEDDSEETEGSSENSDENSEQVADEVVAEEVSTEPFNKNPKAIDFINRQVKKGLSEKEKEIERLREELSKYNNDTLKTETKTQVNESLPKQEEIVDDDFNIEFPEDVDEDIKETLSPILEKVLNPFKNVVKKQQEVINNLNKKVNAYEQEVTMEKNTKAEKQFQETVNNYYSNYSEKVDGNIKDYDVIIDDIREQSSWALNLEEAFEIGALRGLIPVKKTNGVVKDTKKIDNKIKKIEKNLSVKSHANDVNASLTRPAQRNYDTISDSAHHALEMVKKQFNIS